ncbi:Gfo/Idh/MocA family protein [Knoellia aerolata]|uniref:Oxidoreductase n=1 Tax=Knoellia aerolata DSM 18566 TaxID=1385519 RepID=A0A0A0JRW1_9MICO|nr:Gfo/Idh/MocA family oxidoreductase [Knoellia aerolata]KGN39908.1 oxidoreductase [Knoellia aerolata DSM 18566]
MNASIGLAVIGAGYWGPNLVRNAMATEAIDVRWLCDLDVDRAREVLGRYSTISATDSYDAVLDDPAVQAVAIATPAASHFPLAMAALDAGKHVLVEKPLTGSLDDGRKLVQAAEDRGLVLMCDHTYCYTSAVQELRRLVHTGELGQVQFIDSVRINLGLVQPDVNVLWDLAPHDLSILDYLLPPGVGAVAVAAHGADPIGHGMPCVGYLTLRLSNGAMAHVHVNWLSPIKIRTMVVGGSQRTVVWDDMNPSQRLAVYDRGVDRLAPRDLDPDDRKQMRISYRSGDMVAPALTEREALRAMMTEFASSILEHRPPATGGVAGLRVMEILEAAEESLRTGGSFVTMEDTR